MNLVIGPNGTIATKAVCTRLCAAQVASMWQCGYAILRAMGEGYDQPLSYLTAACRAPYLF